MTMECIIEDDNPSIESLYETEESSEYLPDGYCITMAIPNDIDAIVAMRKRIANKLWKDPDTGSQWREPWPDDAGQVERIFASIKAGETHMVWGGEEGVDLVGTFAVSTRGDSRLWTPQEREDDNALYLSRLMAAEKGIGNAIIQTVRDWGEAQAKEFIRIDVWDTNQKLIDYYAQPERGFQVVRQNPIDGYPSCTLMQVVTDRSAPATVTTEAIKAQSEHLLKLPKRVALVNGYDDLGPGGHKNDPYDTWNQSYAYWTEGRTDRGGTRFYCPRLDEGWLYNYSGRVVGSLRYSSFLSSPEYSELLATTGLRELLITSNPKAGILSVERRYAISDYASYETYGRDLNSSRSTLLEGYITEESSVQLSGGDVSLQNFKCYTYRLPTEKENGFQSALLAPGDHVHVLISPDRTHADILKLANGKEHNESEERMEFSARILVNEIYAKLKLGDLSQVHDLVQHFYSYEDVWSKNEEELLRKTLQRHDIYAVEPAMIKFELIDPMYLGLLAAEMRKYLIIQLQDGKVEDLRRCMTHLRTFEPYPEDYQLLAVAIWEKAEEFGCERDVMRTIYAKMVREIVPHKSASKSTAKLIGPLSLGFLKFKDPLPITREPDKV